jgi:outer membrane lipoprotein-sorting protein
MKKYFFVVFLPFLLSNSSNFKSSIDLQQIIEKAENRMRGKSSEAIMSITIVRPKYSREMGLKTWTKSDNYNVMYLMSPARDKGTVYLKRKKEIWYYLPKIERNIKMPPSMMSQSWMGTDMSNDDLVKKTSMANDFSHKLVGEVDLEGRECYEIELIPHDDADVVWGKVKLWVDKEIFNIMKQEQYDEDLELVNTMNASKVKNLGGQIIPTHMEIIPADKLDQKTVMVYKSLEFDVDVPEQYFTTQYMTRIHP